MKKKKNINYALSTLQIPLQQLILLPIPLMERVPAFNLNPAKCRDFVSMLYPIQIAIIAIRSTIIQSGRTVHQGFQTINQRHFPWYRQ